MVCGSRWLQLAGTWTRALLAPALVFIATAVDRNYLTDFWHHLARGRAMVERGGLVDEDLFTYTVHGQPLQDNNWLTQLLYHGLFELGGLPLVQTVNSLTVAVVVGVLVWFCRKKCGSLPVAAVLGVFAFFGMWQLLIIRPQTFSLLLFVLLYVALDQADTRRRWLVLPPVILALWANLHGGFPIGLVLIGGFFLAAVVERCLRQEGWPGLSPRSPGTAPETAAPRPGLLSTQYSVLSTPGSAPTVGALRRGFADSAPATRSVLSPAGLIHLLGGVLSDPGVRAYGLCLAASLLATLANPYGWRVYLYVRTTSAVASVRGIAEWLPPSFGMLIGWVWLLSVLGMLVLFALPGRRPTVREISLVLCFLPPACGSVRMVAWWLLVCVPIAAALLADRLPRRLLQPKAEPPRLLDAAVLGLLLLVVVFSSPLLEHSNPVLPLVRKLHRTESDLEAVAVRLRRQDEAERIFSRFEWGEYLGWALAPRHQVFADGRIEIYPDQVWADYEAVTHGRADWEQILDRYRVDVLLLDADYHTDLLPQVQRPSSGWQETFRAGPAVLFQRRSPLADAGKRFE
jgi:hypothetical protein